MRAEEVKMKQISKNNNMQSQNTLVFVQKTTIIWSYGRYWGTKGKRRVNREGVGLVSAG